MSKKIFICLLIIVTCTLFYVLYPKYYFYHIEGAPFIRANKITGKTEVYSSTKLKWVTVDNKQKQ